jgi:outer membrane protein OmpA-like peptidoglycan-associated protein
MTMKLTCITLSIFICSVVTAQDFVMKKKLADRYYDRFDYHQAIPMYEQLLKTYPADYGIYEKLADSYRRINDGPNTERCYAFVVNKEDVRHEYVLYYAQALARNGKYDLAIKWFHKYDELEPGDSRGKQFSEVYGNISSFYKDSNSYSIHKVPFCSPFSDFSPAYYGNGLVFVSARIQYSMVRARYNWTNSDFLDLFFAYPDSIHATPFSTELNSMYHEGPVTFSKRQDTIIFTRSNFYRWRFRKSNEGINKLKLFQATWDPNQHRWVNIIPLPFNNDQYSVGHPTLSANGRDLYFASDMPGGFGGTDLYVSHLTTDSLGKTSWGTPVNLGADINTRGNELFPYIDNEGNLWFASNGLPGLGGLDIFVARKKADGFEKPINPGYPLNTSFDDFGFITQNGGMDGYLSSDRYNQVGDDDIFSFKRISRNHALLVYDAKTKQIINAASILITADGLEPENKVSNAQGTATLVVKPLKSYQFAITKDTYEDCKLALSKENLQAMDTIFLSLHKRGFKFQLNGKVYAADSNKPIMNATALLFNKTDSSKKQISSDVNGAFTFDLQPETDYIINVTITFPGSKCNSNTIERSTRGIRNDAQFNESFPVFCVGDVIKVENIYYDLGKSNIRQDAAKELDKLLDIMNKYPKMKIELRSHTDSRGTAASNMALSDRRAKAAAEYLYSKGIARDRIIGKGYGETMLLNQCAKGVKCTEDEHKINRRTEFKILSVE